MADDTEDNHVRDAYDQAVEEYEKATRNVLGESSPEDLRKKCEELKKTDHGALVIKSAGQVLKVADLAANAVPFTQGGSAVFTALSYLVDTVDFYREHFTPKNVLECLKDVEDNLRRVTQYVRLEDRGIKLDANLQRSTMDIFAACLTLCRLYTKIAEDSKHATGFIRNLMKAAIRWDDGLSAQLQGMKRATEQEMSNNIAAIRISDISTNDKHTRDQHLERLKNYLKPDNKETHWTGMQDTLCDKHIQGIGDWVFDLEHVKSWINHKYHSDSTVLYISEKKGRGKTHLCSRIIQSLTRSCETQHQKKSTSVGWYFFPGNQIEQKKKGLQVRGGSKSLPMRDALKAVVWQLVQSDRAFHDFVVEVMNSNAQAFSDPKTIWTNVFSKFSQSSKEGSQRKAQKVLYLVLDGFGELDEAEERLIKKMVDDTGKNRTRQVQFRLFLSGTDKFSCHGRKIRPSRICHRSDAVRFIDNTVKHQWDAADPEYRILQSILRKLEMKFRGDFRELGTRLQKVNQSNQTGISDLKILEEEEEEIEEENRSYLTIKHELEAMSNKLDKNEAAVLNELILCTVFWYWWPSLRQLDAYLSMRLGDSYMGDIESILGEKFAGLFFVEDEVVLAQPLLDFVEEEKAWSMRLKDPRSGSKSIQFDQNKGNKQTTQFLLRSICENACRDRHGARYIFEYTAVCLPAHLKDLAQKGIGHFRGMTQKDLGRWLFEALMDQENVGIWLPMGDIDEILAQEKWVEQISDIGIFRRHKAAEHEFLTQYSIAVGNLDQDDTRSEKAIPEMVEPHWLLEASAKVVASQWLQASKWEALPSLKFLLKIVRKIDDYKKAPRGLEASEQSRKEDEKGGDHGDGNQGENEDENAFEDSREKKPSEPEITAKIIKEMEKRALDLLSIKEGQSHYNTTHDLRIAETFMQLGNDNGLEQAEFRCKLIIDREPLNTRALLFLSQVLERNEIGERQALQQLMKIRRIIQSPDFRKDNHDVWEKELNRFWSLCEKTDSVREALTVCAELAVDFQDEPLPSTNALGIAQEWILRQKKLDPSFEILSMKRTEEGRSILTDLFCSNASSYDFHEKFHAIAQNRQSLVFKTYKYAIESTMPWIDVAFLRNHYGIALYRRGRLEDAVKAWRQSVDSFKRHGTSRSDESQVIFKSLRPIVERLGSTYCEIIGTGKDSGSASQYIRKLEEDKAWIDHEYPMEVNYVALLLGRVYRFRHEDQKAVNSVRKFMSKAFDLLEDDKQDNDWNGYFLLAELFTTLADDNNAQAAWSLVANVLESERDYDWNLSCAGGCDKHWDVSEDLKFDLYVCRDCPHLYFERSCWKLLQSKALDHRSCSRNHEFLHVSKHRAGAVKRLKPDRVLVGRDEMWIDDWLEGLRRQYGIPGPKKGRVGQTVKAFHVEKWKWRRETRTTAGKIRNAVSKSPKFPH